MKRRFLLVSGAALMVALEGCSTTPVHTGQVAHSLGGAHNASSTATSMQISRDQVSAGAAIERSVNSPVTAGGATYPIASFVDGDTIKVLVNGRRQIVRLLGVDTPETKKPHTPVECYGEEASAHMKSLVSGKSVQLVTDPTQGATDKYGRWLRYVFVNGEDVGLSQIAGGFAREYTYDKAYRGQGAYRQAQAAAQEKGLGTWSSVCNGFHLSDGKVIAAAVKPGSNSSAYSDDSQQNSPTSRSSTSTDEQVSESASAPTASSASGGLTAQAPGCQIKGNITGGKKLAHVPGDDGYARTKITPNTGERWFCSVADAEAAGWAMAK